MSGQAARGGGARPRAAVYAAWNAGAETSPAGRRRMIRRAWWMTRAGRHSSIRRTNFAWRRRGRCPGGSMPNIKSLSGPARVPSSPLRRRAVMRPRCWSSCWAIESSRPPTRAGRQTHGVSGRPVLRRAEPGRSVVSPRSSRTVRRRRDVAGMLVIVAIAGCSTPDANPGGSSSPSGYPRS